MVLAGIARIDICGWPAPFPVIVGLRNLVAVLGRDVRGIS
jgi:hypothetical protein